MRLSKVMVRGLLLAVALVFSFYASGYAITRNDLNAIVRGHPFYDPLASECSLQTESDPVSNAEPGPLFVLGDSLGVGVTPELGPALGSEWSVSGDSRTGRTIGEGITAAKNVPATSKHVLVILGTNPDSNLNANGINQLVSALPAEANVYWLTVNVTRTDLTAGAEKFNSILQSTSGVSTIKNSANLSSDRVHPADYKALAASIAAQIIQGGTSATASGSVKELAQKMLDNPNVSYWTNNGVNTRDVVAAMAAGKKAYTTSNDPYAKEHREVDINPNILKFILEVAEKNPVMVNALTDKDHTGTSNHYKGLAVDLDNNRGNSPPTSVLDPIAKKYGGTRNSETTHWHYNFTDTGSSEEPSTDPEPSSSSGAGCTCDPSSSSAVPIEGDNAERMFKFFTALGLSKEQAAGIVGNAMAESGNNIDPTIVSGAGYRGIFQWSTSRWAKLVAWAQAQGKNPDEFATQVEYGFYEATEMGVIEGMKKQTSVELATWYWGRYFEIAIVNGSRSEEPLTNVQHLDKRIDNARSVFDKFGGVFSNIGSTAAATSICGASQAVGDASVDTSGSACPTGTEDGGVHQDYGPNRSQGVKIRICGLPGYIPASTGVNVSIAAATLDMLNKAKSEGVILSGNAFRSYERQVELRVAHCPDPVNSRASDCSPPTAKPGTSMHEVGLAIDFSNCNTRSSACYRWLNTNASKYGLLNLPSEAWHWSVNGN